MRARTQNIPIEYRLYDTAQAVALSNSNVLLAVASLVFTLVETACDLKSRLRQLPAQTLHVRSAHIEKARRTMCLWLLRIWLFAMVDGQKRVVEVY